MNGRPFLAPDKWVDKLALLLPVLSIIDELADWPVSLVVLCCFCCWHVRLLRTVKWRRWTWKICVGTESGTLPGWNLRWQLVDDSAKALSNLSADRLELQQNATKRRLIFVYLTTCMKRVINHKYHLSFIKCQTIVSVCVKGGLPNRLHLNTAKIQQKTTTIFCLVCYYVLFFSIDFVLFQK